jgi:phage-related protein
MFGFFTASRTMKPYKLIWKNVRRYIRENPGAPTHVLWKLATFRLSKAAGVVGYNFAIEDLARSTFNCVTSLPADKRNICASAIRAISDEDRKAGQERLALCGDLAWSLLRLVDLELSGQRSARLLLKLIEAGFRGASSSIIATRQANSEPRSEQRIRFQWSTFREQEHRANIFVVLRTAADGTVQVTCNEIPYFHATFSSIEEAKDNLPSVLSDFLGEQMGGPAIIWTPDDWASNTQRSCQVHILDPRGSRIENWIIGEQVKPETYDKFKDSNGRLYITVTYEKGEPNVMFVQKVMWDQVAQQFAAIDREASEAFEDFKRYFPRK